MQIGQVCRSARRRDLISPSRRAKHPDLILQEPTMDVRGKAAIVTGSATGVGRETAFSLARLGCDVAINYSRSADEAEQTAREVRDLGVRAIAVKADVSVDAECRE